MSLSVVIITFNEEANLARTLDSVAWADEIVIVDSGSTDRTRDIAESFHAKFFVEAWKGFAAQKNSALQKAGGDWILSLDADDEVEPALADEIRQTLPANPSAAGFWPHARISSWVAGFVTAASIPIPSSACFAAGPENSKIAWCMKTFS